MIWLRLWFCQDYVALFQGTPVISPQLLVCVSHNSVMVLLYPVKLIFWDFYF